MRLEAATQNAISSGTLPEGESVLSPDQAMEVVCQYLSVEQRIKVSKGGRSSIPPRCVLRQLLGGHAFYSLDVAIWILWRVVILVCSTHANLFFDEL